MIVVILLLSISTSWAFPEFIRYGYPNCTTCHVSPSGGGLLNQYGRVLSKEALSTWGTKGEENFAYGVVKTPENVNLQGYVRLLQLHRETPALTEGRAILMQADLEGSYRLKNVTGVATIGRQEKIDRGDKIVQPISRRHYLLWKANEKLAVRAGKFGRYFGLNTPYHTSYVYRDLGFGQDTETYNVEASYYHGNFSFFATSILGTYRDKTTYANERAQSVSAQYAFLRTQKVGATFYHGEEEAKLRNIAGPWFILSYDKNLFLMTEAFYQESKDRASKDVTKGYVNTNRLNYQVYKGVIPFLGFEAAQTNWSNDATKRQSYGGGLQFFPRPHFELLANYQKERYYSGEGYFADLYYFMLNFYL